jgi:hypothetical protein
MGGLGGVGGGGLGGGGLGDIGEQKQKLTLPITLTHVDMTRTVNRFGRLSIRRKAILRLVDSS